MKQFKELQEELNHLQDISEKRLSDEARELEVHAENDADLYRQQFMPIVRNMMLKMIRGQYDKGKAAKAWLNYYDNAARSYNWAYNRAKGITPWMTKPIRMEAAKELEISVRNEISFGNWDGELDSIRGAMMNLKKQGDPSTVWDDIKKKL